MGVFCWFFENNCPGAGVLARFSAPGVGVSHFLSAKGVGNSPFQKDSPGVSRGGWSGFELTGRLKRHHPAQSE